MNTGVTKATNTASSYFDDLGINDPEAHNTLTVNKRVRSVRPRDNDSFASSASKNSKKLKNVMQAVKISRSGKDDEAIAHLHLKKSLASLSEEGSSIKGGHSGDLISPKKIGKFSRGKSREAAGMETKLMSPENNHKNLMSSMHHITQSMDYGTPDPNFEEEEVTGTDKNGRPRNAKPRSRHNKKTNSNASTPRNKRSDKKTPLDSLGEMVSIPETGSKNQGKRKESRHSDYKGTSWSISQNKPGNMKAERLTITLLKTVTWKPKLVYNKGRLDGVVQKSLVRTDSFKPWPGKSSNEDIVSMQASGKIRSKDTPDLKEDTVVLRNDDKIQVTTYRAGNSKHSQGQTTRDKFPSQEKDYFRKNSRKLKDVLGSASEKPKNTTTMSNRNDTEDSFFKSRVEKISRPMDGEEHTTLKTIQENTTTNLTWNHKPPPRKPGNSFENQRNRTFHGSNPKPHLDLENPYTKQPTKYLDHFEDSKETIKKTKVSKIDNFIDKNLKSDKNKRDRKEDLHNRLYQDGFEAAEERRKKILAYEEGAAQDWEERNLRKKGVLCKNVLPRCS